MVQNVRNRRKMAKIQNLLKNGWNLERMFPQRCSTYPENLVKNINHNPSYWRFKSLNVRGDASSLFESDMFSWTPCSWVVATAVTTKIAVTLFSLKNVNSFLKCQRCHCHNGQSFYEKVDVFTVYVPTVTLYSRAFITGRAFIIGKIVIFECVFHSLNSLTIVAVTKTVTNAKIFTDATCMFKV